MRISGDGVEKVMAEYMNREDEPKGREDLGFGTDDAFPLQSTVGAKIHEQAEFEAGYLEVVVDLGAVLVGQGFDRLEFDDDFIEAKQIERVGVTQGYAAISDRKISLGIEEDFAMGEFDLHAVLVNRFHVAVTLCGMHRHACAVDQVGFFFVEDGFGHGGESF
jgi:hypothetical protein